MKSEFVCVQPKSPEASQRFDAKMDRFHSCRVDDRRDGKVFLSSISGRYLFSMTEDGDEHWEIIR